MGVWRLSSRLGNTSCASKLPAATLVMRVVDKNRRLDSSIDLFFSDVKADVPLSSFFFFGIAKVYFTPFRLHASKQLKQVTHLL